jgi:hypothetical protein
MVFYLDAIHYLLFKLHQLKKLKSKIHYISETGSVSVLRSNGTYRVGSFFSSYLKMEIEPVSET